MTGPRRPMLCDGLDCHPLAPLQPGPGPAPWRHEPPCTRGLVEATDGRHPAALDGSPLAAQLCAGAFTEPLNPTRPDTP